MPERSIIMPAHDSEDTIESSIQNLLSQSFSDFELILIDDGSTDRTSRIAKQYMSKDDRLLYYYQDQAGAAAARNKGIEIARGNYCLFLDADDYYSSDLLMLLHNSITSNNADICVCEADSFNVQTKKRYPLIRFRSSTSACIDTQQLGASLFKTCYTAPWNKLIRTELIRLHHLRYQNIAAHNDVYFVCSCLAYSKTISFVAEPLILYSVGSGHSIQDKRVRHPFCEFDALDLLSLEGCIRDAKEGDYLHNAFRSLVVDAFFNSAPAVIAGNASFHDCYERFLRLMNHEDSIARPEKGLSMMTRFKEYILLSSSEDSLKQAFSAFADQRRHAANDKLLFVIRILLSRFKR